MQKLIQKVKVSATTLIKSGLEEKKRKENYFNDEIKSTMNLIFIYISILFKEVMLMSQLYFFLHNYDIEIIHFIMYNHC